MLSRIREDDWTVFKQLRATALERLCARALEDCARICEDDSRAAVERHQEVRDRLRSCDRDLDAAFDDLRRSTALLRLVQFQDLGLLRPDEIGRLSEGTRRWLDSGSSRT